MAENSFLDIESLVSALSSLIGSIFYYVSRLDNAAIKNLEEAPSVEVGPGLNDILKDSKELPYIAIRGAVTPLSSQLIKSESGVNAVLQVVVVNEHSMRRHTTGFWGNSVREIVQTRSEVPFGLKSLSSSSPLVVEISDPSFAVQENLLMPTSSKFNPATPGLSGAVFGFFTGNASTGIETTEKLLPLDSKITAIGSLVLGEGGKMKLVCPTDNDNFRYILSTYPVENILKLMVSRQKGFRIVSWIFFGIAIAFFSRKGLKLYKDFQERQMRLRILREREQRAAAPNVNNNPEGAYNIQLCIICLTNPREVILLECGHVCVCADCLLRLNRVCPICRVEFSSTHAAYIS